MALSSARCSAFSKHQETNLLFLDTKSAANLALHPTAHRCAVSVG